MCRIYSKSLGAHGCGCWEQPFTLKQKKKKEKTRTGKQRTERSHAPFGAASGTRLWRWDSATPRRCQKTASPEGLIPGGGPARNTLQTVVNGKGWTWKGPEWKTIKQTYYFLIPFVPNSGLMSKISLRAPRLGRTVDNYTFSVKATAQWMCLVLVSEGKNYSLSKLLAGC